MTFFDKNNNPVEFENLEKLHEGKDGSIYRDEGLALKVYHCNYKKIMSKKLFELLKEYKIENLVELYDYYYCYRQLPIFKSFSTMDAYTMKYVDDERVSLLSADIGYIKMVLKQMEITARELNDRKIRIHDAHDGNIIFGTNGVTFIDVDQFHYDKNSTPRDMYKANKSEMIKYLNYTISHELRDNGYIELYNRNLFYSGDYSSLTEDVLKRIKGDKIEELVRKLYLKK